MEGTSAEMRERVRCALNEQAQDYRLTAKDKARMEASPYFTEFNRVMDEQDAIGSVVELETKAMHALEGWDLYNSMKFNAEMRIAEQKKNMRSLGARAGRLCSLMLHDPDGELLKAKIPLKTLIKVAERGSVPDLVRNVRHAKATREEWAQHLRETGKEQYAEDEIMDRAVELVGLFCADGEANMLAYFAKFNPEAVGVIQLREAKTKTKESCAMSDDDEI